MAAAVLPYRRPVGRASVMARQRDLLLEERTALRAELREVGHLLPRARANYHYITTVADSVDAERNAAQIYYLVDRIHRRYPDDAA